MDNRENRINSRARRRPEDVTRTSSRAQTEDKNIRTNPSRTINHNAQSSGRNINAGHNNQTRQNTVRNSNYYSGKIPQNSRNMTAVRNVYALTPEEEKKIIRAEERRANREKAEAEWQKDIVRVKGGIDILMLAIILILLALGTITVFSASYPFAIAKGLPSNYFIKRQIIFLAIGGGAMALFAIIPIGFWNKRFIAWASMIFSCILLGLVLVFGSSEGEATRWLRIGPIGIQPSEIMKVTLILALAYYCHKYEESMKELDFGWSSYRRNTLYPLMIIGIACFFILIGKHLSGTVITAAIGIFMLIIAGTNMGWAALTALPVGGIGVALFLAINPYAMQRITTFLNDNADKYDEKYQTIQSILAIGNGGLFGVGLGKSVQKYSYLSAAHTDFIFSIWCEEWGFVGAVVLILLYMLFLWRGYKIAIQAPDRFSMLVAFGITTQVGLQAILNICVATDTIMNTGISLPFFSYGGSSLVVLMAEMGLLLSISRQSYKKKSELVHEELLKRAGIQ